MTQKTYPDQRIAALEEAVATACSAYDPAEEAPEIIDAEGRIVFDTAELMQMILDGG